tara:strand:+ start:29 stop:409 length:381 start_codon:yes stop_codon:yes gene_type:complete
MVISTTRKDLFHDWLLWLDPVFKLSVAERKLLAGYLTIHYYHRHRFSNLITLDDLLFSQSTTDVLLKRNKLTQKKFDEIFAKLKAKGFITDYQDEDKDPHQKLNPAITKYPVNERFSINVDLKING